MRNLVGVSILGISVCLLFVSGCGGGGVGEAEVKKVGEAKLDMFNKKLAIARNTDMNKKLKEEKIAEIKEDPAIFKSYQNFSDSDKAIYKANNYASRVESLEKEFLSELNKKTE